MKSRKLIILGLLGLVLVVGLSGCIISASPDTNQIIEMKPGDKVLFKVVGPVNTLTTKCVWTINNSATNEVVSEGKNEFELDFNADSKLSNKKNIITCEYLTYMYGCTCGGICICHLGWWHSDWRKWEVRTSQNSAIVITGDYIIENDSDLQLLKGTTTVTGSLRIGTNIKSLEGLESLTTIGGDLSIYGNDALTSLSSLENIKSIGGNLDISSNDALTSLSGLQNITSISGDLYIFGNHNLSSLTSLENLTSVGGKLVIEYTYSLISLSGLENLTSVGGGLYISGNTALTSLSCLGNLKSIGGSLWIENAALTSLSGLKNITSLGGDLIIAGPALTSLSGLENIKSVGGSLYIRDSDALTNLSCLENLASIGGGLIINYNATLSSLGLLSLRFVGSNPLWGGFYIVDNPSLCKYLAEELRNQCILVIGSTTISGNKDCTTP